MADVKSQIPNKPVKSQNIRPVLQRFQQMRREASEDSAVHDATTAPVSSDAQNKMKSFTLDRGHKFGETTSNGGSGTKLDAASSANQYKIAQGRSPAVTNNTMKEQESAHRKPTQTSATINSNITATNPSSDQQLTKQSSSGNVVDRVHQKFAQLNETKSQTFNRFSPRNANLTDSSKISSAPTTIATSSSSSPTLKTPPSSSSDEGTVIDFRSALRPTRNSVLSEIFEKTPNSTSGPTSASASSSNSVVTSSPSSSASASSYNSVVTSSPSSSGAAKSRITDSPWKNSASDVSAQTTPFGVQSFSSKRQSNNDKNITKPDKTGQGEVATRNSDQKQFRRIILEFLSPSLPPPRKPELPKKIDLTEIRQKYLNLVGNTQKSPQSWAAGATQEQPGDQRQTERVSLIKEISAEEEYGPVYDDGYSLTPVLASGSEELYADGETETQAGGGKDSDVYEEAVLLTGSLEAKARKQQQQKEQAEIRKREEKDRKEKEKEEKRKLKEDKMKTKKDKELQQQQKHFHLTGNEDMVGDGVMKQDFKDLSLKQGQKVTIVRLDHNPPSMWLVKTDTGMGYVCSSFIEVDPLVIRQAMNNIRRSVDENEDDDSIYDSVE